MRGCFPPLNKAVRHTILPQVTYKLQHKLLPYFLLTPAFLLIAIFIFLPLFKAFYFAFENYILTAPNERVCIGLGNFSKLLSDETFWLSLKNTIVWVLGSLAGQFVLGFALALLLQKPFRGRSLYRAIVFSPWAISGFLIAVIWKWLLNPQYGPVNALLMKTGLLSAPVAFLSHPNYALPSVITANIWYGIPFFAIMLGAGLSTIPDELYQAAAIDGAGAVQKFVHITLPVLAPVIAASLLLRSIWIFNFADLVWIMTAGGPANKSQILITYLFTTAYKNLNFGYAGAISVTIFLLMASGILAFVLLSKMKNRT